MRTGGVWIQAGPGPVPYNLPVQGLWSNGPIRATPAARRIPLCPVCLQEIKAQDRVSGLRDDIMHEACDYMGEHRPLKPPPKPSRSG